MVLVKEVLGRFEGPLFEKEQLEMYQFLAKISISQLSADVGELRLYLDAVRKAMKS
jgi:hypothetical protein